MRKVKVKRILIIAALLLVIFAAFGGGALADRLLGPNKSLKLDSSVDQTVVREESVVIDVAEKVSPSVVTVTIQTPARRVLNFDMFRGFQSQMQGGEPQDIGSGFVVSSDGLIVTNKHVVSDTSATYKVVTKDDKEYEVKQIDRDPSNDIAILKIDASGLQPVNLGDSDNLKVGQFAIAIGTALGEFRHTVTTGVISGLGRGITAGSPYEGYVEQLDNVIQTDAAINPGNSGGPLLNSAGQVIGVNVAIAQGAQNIGFAIPVNILKSGLEQFSSNGKFEAKPFLGVRHSTVTRKDAILNDLPEGAYIESVESGSPAESAGIQEGDIITTIDGNKINEDNQLADVIASKKVGDQIRITVWRDDKTLDLLATLAESPNQ